MTDQSIASSDKRRLILDAAVRVFARDGYHTSRVGDIALEAGVAHGLLYHYFGSKDELLTTIFRETWESLLQALREVESSDDPAPEQLRKVCAIVLRTWKREPDLVRVLVREVTSSRISAPSAESPTRKRPGLSAAELGREVGEIGEAFAAIERLVERGQKRGELRPGLEPRLAAVIVYGALEEILTGWVLEQLPDGDDDVEQAERAVVEVICFGLALDPVPTRA